MGSFSPFRIFYNAFLVLLEFERPEALKLNLTGIEYCNINILHDDSRTSSFEGAFPLDPYLDLAQSLLTSNQDYFGWTVRTLRPLMD